MILEKFPEVCRMNTPRGFEKQGPIIKIIMVAYRPQIWCNSSADQVYLEGISHC